MSFSSPFESVNSQAAQYSLVVVFFKLYVYTFFSYFGQFFQMLSTSGHLGPKLGPDLRQIVSAVDRPEKLDFGQNSDLCLKWSENWD